MHIPLKAVTGLVAVSLVLAACAPAPTGTGTPETGRAAAPGDRPPDARPGACYGKDVTPAVVEVVTDQVLVQPARKTADGSIIQPAVYRTETHQAIVEERREIYFEVPCAEILTPDFIASLQRALKARSLFHGPVTGLMDARTREAIRRLQRPTGLNSDILTIETARRLGLIAYAQ